VTESLVSPEPFTTVKRPLRYYDTPEQAGGNRRSETFYPLVGGKRTSGTDASFMNPSVSKMSEGRDERTTNRTLRKMRCRDRSHPKSRFHNEGRNAGLRFLLREGNATAEDRLAELIRSQGGKPHDATLERLSPSGPGSSADLQILVSPRSCTHPLRCRPCIAA